MLDIDRYTAEEWRGCETERKGIDMDIRQVAPDYAVSGQITPADVTEIARRGFRSIVCHRPDGEAAGQPDHASIEQAARAAGLEFRYIPIVSGQMTGHDIDAMVEALASLPAPVLGYCRSGARSTNVYKAARGQSA
jgi:uncharacterized protein (TIGR01244 family)